MFKLISLWRLRARLPLGLGAAMVQTGSSNLVTGSGEGRQLLLLLEGLVCELGGRLGVLLVNVVRLVGLRIVFVLLHGAIAGVSWSF